MSEDIGTHHKRDDESDDYVEVHYRYGPAEFEGKGKHNKVKEHVAVFHSSLPGLLRDIPLPPTLVLPASEALSVPAQQIRGEVDAQQLILGPAEIPGSQDDHMEVLKRFSKELGVSQEILIGACDPSLDPPFLRLDRHAWASFRKQMPPRGPTSIGPLATALTLLCLWFQFADLGNPTIELGYAVLKAISEGDTNGTRGLNRREWLRVRGKDISINPAKIDMALSLAQAFCRGQRFEFRKGLGKAD